MDNQLLKVLLAIIFPPLGVYLASENNPNQMRRTIISAVLLMIVVLPAIVYALDIVLDKKWFYPKLDQ